MKLYGYYRSSAAFRLRIALNLKQLGYDNAFIHLRRRDQARADFLGVNPQGLVPALEADDIALAPRAVNRLDLAPYPTIARNFEAYMQLDAFAAAHPARQPDRDE